MPAAGCTLVIVPAQPADGDPWVGLEVGEVQVVQRPRSYEQAAVPDHQLSVTDGDFAKLVGADVPRIDPNSSVPAEVVLYWRAIGTADLNYTVFLHLIGPDGVIWAQSDSEPAGGQAPTMTWLAPEIIVDEHTLTLPESAPEGSYDLYVGLYDAQRGTRRKLYREGVELVGDRARITGLTVGP
jgi:hypothetical protein